MIPGLVGEQGADWLKLFERRQAQSYLSSTKQIALENIYVSLLSSFVIHLTQIYFYITGLSNDCTTVTRFSELYKV